MSELRFTSVVDERVFYNYLLLDGVPVQERVKTATRQMIISNF